MSSITPEMIAELERLDGEATPGPWEVDYQPPGACGAKCYMNGIKAYLPSDGVYVDVVRQGQTNNRTWPRVIKDGDFIAAMRNALPALLAERRERETLLGEAFEALCDGDPIACACEKTDGVTIVTPKYSGECLFCRLRAVLGRELGD